MPKDSLPSLPSLSKILKLTQSCLSSYDSATSDIPKEMFLLTKSLRIVSGSLQSLQEVLNGMESDLPPDLLSLLSDLESDVKKITQRLSSWHSNYHSRSRLSVVIPTVKPFIQSMGPAMGLYLAMLPMGIYHGIGGILLLGFIGYLYSYPEVLSELRDSWEDKDSELLQKYTETLDRSHRNIQHFLLLQHQLRDSKRYDVGKVLTEDKDARAFWIKNFGSETYNVETNHFIQILLYHCNMDNMGVSDTVRKVIYQCIYNIVDNNRDGKITPLEFHHFLQYFGPLPLAGKKILEGLIDYHGTNSTTNPVSIYRWFSWRSMDRTDSQHSLPPIPGTFLIRCSSQSGKFAVDYIRGDGVIQHSIVCNDKVLGYHFENISTYFPHLSALVSHYKSRLQYPYLDPTQMIKFNVSGTIFECQLSLFLPYPHTKLYKLLTSYQRIDDHTPIYFDKDPSIFNYILNFYRYGYVAVPYFVDRKMVGREMREFELPVGEGDIVVNGGEEGREWWMMERKRNGKEGKEVKKDDDEEGFSPPSMPDSEDEDNHSVTLSTSTSSSLSNPNNPNKSIPHTEEKSSPSIPLPFPSSSSLSRSGPFANHEAVKAAMKRVAEKEKNISSQSPLITSMAAPQSHLHEEKKEISSSSSHPPLIRIVSDESYSQSQHDLPSPVGDKTKNPHLHPSDKSHSQSHLLTRHESVATSSSHHHYNHGVDMAKKAEDNNHGGSSSYAVFQLDDFDDHQSADSAQTQNSSLSLLINGNQKKNEDENGKDKDKKKEKKSTPSVSHGAESTNHKKKDSVSADVSACENGKQQETTPQRSSNASLPSSSPPSLSTNSSTSSTSSSSSSSTSSISLPSSLATPISVRGLSQEQLQSNLNKAFSASAAASSSHGNPMSPSFSSSTPPFLSPSSPSTSLLIPTTNPSLLTSHSFSQGGDANYRVHGILTDDFDENDADMVMKDEMMTKKREKEGKGPVLISSLRVQSILNKAVREGMVEGIHADKSDGDDSITKTVGLSNGISCMNSESPKLSSVSSFTVSSSSPSCSSSSADENPYRMMDNEDFDKHPNGENIASVSSTALSALTSSTIATAGNTKKNNMSGSNNINNIVLKVGSPDVPPSSSPHLLSSVTGSPSMYDAVVESSPLPSSPSSSSSPSPTSALASSLSLSASSSPSPSLPVSLYIESFAFWKSSISRPLCESLLRPLPPHTFLFRTCSDPTEYVNGRPSDDVFVLCFYKDKEGGAMQNTKIYRYRNPSGLSPHKPMRDKEGKMIVPSHLHADVQSLVESVIGKDAKGVEK